MDCAGGYGIHSAPGDHQPDHTGSCGNSFSLGAPPYNLPIVICAGVLQRTLVFPTNICHYIFYYFPLCLLGDGAVRYHKYPHSGRDIFIRVVCSLHGLQWRVVQVAPALYIPDSLLPDGLRGRGIRWDINNICCTLHFQGILGATAWLRALLDDIPCPNRPQNDQKTARVEIYFEQRYIIQHGHCYDRTYLSINPS